MNSKSIASLTRLLIDRPSRRDILHGLAAVGFGMAATQHAGDAEAKKKHKKHKRKKRKQVTPPTPNEFGCLEVGDACTSEDDCCSGICDDKRCRAHDTGTCDQSFEKEICLASTVDDVLRLRCDNNGNCACHRTTANSRYCSEQLLNEGDPRCADCKNDADCVALGYPAGSACAPVSQGICAGACPTGMACLTPCGTEFPQLSN